MIRQVFSLVTNMRRTLAILTLFALLVLTSFTSDKRFTLETKPGETILIGKLDIYNKGKLKNKDISFQIRNIETGSKKKIKLDHEGYFISKVPAGSYEIKEVYYKGSYIKLPHGYLTVSMNDPNSIFYIGDIYINWSPLHYDRRESSYFVPSIGVPLGLVGGLAVGLAAGAIMAATESNVDLMPAIVNIREATTERFSSRYPKNEKDVIPQPIDIYIYENGEPKK